MTLRLAPGPVQCCSFPGVLHTHTHTQPPKGTKVMLNRGSWGTVGPFHYCGVGETLWPQRQESEPSSEVRNSCTLVGTCSCKPNHWELKVARCDPGYVVLLPQATKTQAWAVFTNMPPVPGQVFGADPAFFVNLVSWRIAYCGLVWSDFLMTYFKWKQVW